MKDEEKTKEELISELMLIRKKYTGLKEFLSKSQKVKQLAGTETILVVEDNNYTRTAIVQMLEICGYKILEADSARKAIEMFESQEGKIHLVLSDVVMPEVNGLEMVEKILPLQAEVKIIFMSGYAEGEIIHEDVSKVLQSRHPFIEKPFTFEEIGLIVRQHLDNTI